MGRREIVFAGGSSAVSTFGGRGVQQARPQVLVVDDDAAARYAKTRILRRAGYSISEADNGEAALQRVAEDSPDLVLLDVRLPDMDGLEVCRQIKADSRTAHTLVLQTSASLRNDDAKVSGLECGADGYLAEPMEPSLLVATVAAFLRTRQAERAVREHAVEWQATFDAIRDGIALINTAGEVLRANRAMRNMFQKRDVEITGRSLDEILPPASTAGRRKRNGESVWRSLKAGERQLLEREAVGRFFSVSLDPVCDPHGKLLGAVCTASDVTERQLIDERLQQSQKLESIGLLAGGVAHDFNNLLTGILGNASLGLDAASDPEIVARALRDIVRSSERAADLTRQLLAYSGKGKFVVRPVDLSQIVRGMLPLVKTSLSRKVELVLDLARDLPAIEADRTQIEQIVLNLLMNAAEAVGDRAEKVTVTTRAVHVTEEEGLGYLSERRLSGDYVTLQVRDTGEGMSAETLRQIFDPFFTTKFMGRGLGLSAVLGILRGHDGAIRVTSAPGDGATFDLLFPRAAAAAETEMPRTITGSSIRHGDGRPILVVDDEPVVRNFFHSALQRAGYDVVIAENGAEALRILRADPGRFSLVLLDLVMPVMSGKEVLPLLLELRPDARILITSGQVEEEVRREVGDWPIAGFIPKPCAASELVEKIAQCWAPKARATG